MPIVIRPAAAADIEEAFFWYERQRPGLGDEFLAKVNNAYTKRHSMREQIQTRLPQVEELASRNLVVDC